MKHCNNRILLILVNPCFTKSGKNRTTRFPNNVIGKAPQGKYQFPSYFHFAVLSSTLSVKPLTLWSENKFTIGKTKKRSPSVQRQLTLD